MDGVTLYSTRLCGFCSRAKALLLAKGVEFTEVGLDDDPEARQALMKRTGQRTVPQIFVGDVHVGGFRELATLDQRGGLDALLDTHGIDYSD
ncbi:MAG TPA: glutaredoxin 3 [Deltaproteobacteria bacterium]|nr:glutaredoxin 3 [Deltaproteobacteria bacterium]HCP46637.1 glutaredoxin 3 [Deltaproteobacteria bacterium]